MILSIYYRGKLFYATYINKFNHVMFSYWITKRSKGGIEWPTF